MSANHHAFPWFGFEGHVGRLYRALIFRRQLAALGPGSFISPFARLTNMRCISVGARTMVLRGSLITAVREYRGVEFSPKIVIGDDVYVGHRCTLCSVNELLIGPRVTLGDHVYLSDSMHAYADLHLSVMHQPLKAGRITIGEGAWLGYGAVVAGTIDIGAHAIVAANSVVTSSVPPYTMVGGAPARVIKRLDDERQSWVRVDGAGPALPSSSRP